MAMPAAIAASRPSANGKKPSVASTAPRAPAPARLVATVVLITSFGPVLYRLVYSPIAAASWSSGEALQTESCIL